VARIVVIGNAAGGKSTLARHLARRRELPLIELDRLLWQPGWQLMPEPDYTRGHVEIIARERWVIDGLGRQDSIAERLARSTEIVLIDMPLWIHFAHAAERQIAWGARTAQRSAGGGCGNAADAGAVSYHVGGGADLDAGHSQHVRGGRTGGQSGDAA
jgi:adenylate kinase family enzyme